MISLEELVEGFDYVETLAELRKRLDRPAPLRVKLGFDPTSADLHIGHTVVLRRLQRFIAAGHQAVLVIGDFTARIGDPTGRNDQRPPLSNEQIAANMRTYTEQAGRILDLDKVEIRYNSEWLEPLGMAKVIELLAHVTVAQMLAREDFSQRYHGGTPIALHEFLYPVAQAYDSVALRADIELGGNDQRFNVLMGRHFQAIFDQEPQICMTTPILEGLDGVKKMSKSLHNYIAVTDLPEDQFGKTMRITDELIARYRHLVLGASSAESASLAAALENGSAHPMDEKKRLAADIVREFHGAAAAERARDHFERTVQRHEQPETARVLQLTAAPKLAEAMVAAGFASSKREAQRLIAGGGVRVGGAVARDHSVLIESSGSMLSVGSRNHVILQW